MLRRIEGVPARRVEPVLQQAAHIVAATTAVVEQRTAAVEEAMAGEGLHRRREAIARQGRQVSRRLPSGRVWRWRWCIGTPCVRLAIPAFIVADRHQRMVDDAIPPLAHQLLPLAFVADAPRVIEQPDGFAGRRQRRPGLPPRIIRRQQQLLAVQDRRVERIRIGAMAQGAGGKIHPPTLRERREGLLDEAWIVEQRQLRTIRIDPHQVEVLAPADAGELLSCGELLCESAGDVRARPRLERVDMDVALAPHGLADGARSIVV